MAAGAGPNARAAVSPQIIGGSTSGLFVSPNWFGGNPRTVPPARGLAFGSFESNRADNILFGGFGASLMNDTWSWNGTTWAKLAPAASPSARDGNQMDYDAATGASVLFGGWNGTTEIGDTWTWNGTTWTQLAIGAPPARTRGAMVYDAALGKIVLFGGRGTGGVLGDTWVFNGSAWSQLAVSGPSARVNAGVAYDAHAGVVVLYGGDNGASTPTYLGDTWIFNGTSWAQQAPAHSPGPRSVMGMTYDPSLARPVLFGGSSSTSVFTDMWLWTGSDWQHGQVGILPTARTSPFFEAAAVHGQVLLEGGFDPSVSPLDDTHVLDWELLGNQRGAKNESYTIDDREGFGVNVGNGNLTIGANDVSISSAGISLSLTRHYNSRKGLAGQGMGPGWAIDTAPGYLSPYPDGSVTLFNAMGAGGQLYFHMNSNGTFTSPAGIDATLTGSAGSYTLTYHASSEKQTYTNYQLASDADRNGNKITYAYDTSSRLSTITDTEGRVVTFGYDATTSALTSITDSTGRKWTYGYTNGFLTSFTDPGNAVTQYAYDSNGLLNKVTDPVGSVTQITYDIYLKVASVTRVAPTGTSPVTSYSYLPGSANQYFLKTTSTDANNHTTTYQAQYGGLVTQVVDARGLTRSSGFTADNNVLSLTNATSAVYQLKWDTSNNLQSITSPNDPNTTGAVTTATYTDTAHPFQMNSITDAQSNCTSFSYDAAGNILTARAGLTAPCAGASTGGLTVTNTYQGTNSVTCGAKTGSICSSTDGNGHVTTYAYDGSGNLVKVTPPAPLAARTIVPDALSRVSSITDGKGQKTSYQYDANDRITQLLFGGATTCSTSAGTCITYAYDGAGNLKTRADATGTTSNSYDFENRVTAKNGPGGNTSVTYDPVGNVASYTDPSGTNSYTYDADNNVIDVVEPGGSQSTCGTSGSACSVFQYDNNNRVHVITYPNGVTVTINYDAAGQETSVAATRSTGTIVSRTYGYLVGTGNTDLRQSVTDQSGNKYSYTYDGLDRLKTATSSASSIPSLVYSYDAAGNITQVQSTTSGVTTTTNHTFNAANELLDSGFSYDANGNLTAKPSQTYAYNSLNQTTSITTSGTQLPFGYADVGQAERTSAGSVTYVNGLVGLTQQSGGSTLAFTRTPSGALVSMRSGTNHFYYVLDALGSVIALTNSSAGISAVYTYDPYGNILTSSGTQASTNPFRYASGYFDASTGLTKFGTRYYDPSLGRWTQLDPMGGSVGKAGTNGYVYAGDTPVNNTDPSGALSLNGTILYFTNSDVMAFLFTEASIGPFALAAALDAIATALSGPVGGLISAALDAAGWPTLLAIDYQLLQLAVNHQGFYIGISFNGFFPNFAYGTWCGCD